MPANGPTPDHEIQTFINEYAELAAPREEALGKAYWNLATTGTEESQAALVEAGLAYNEVFSDPDDFETLRRWHGEREGHGDALTRQVTVLYKTFAASQGDRETLERTQALEAQASSVYSNHRAEVDGEKIGSNRVRDILRSSTDEALRRKAWASSKTVGREVSETVRELARLRNKIAQEQGYRDHHHRSLDLQEIDPGELEGIMSALKEATDKPFGELKARVDEHLLKKFGVAEVMPWHLSDPFFQDAKLEIGEAFGYGGGLDGAFAGKDIEALTKKTYDNLGLEVRGVMKVSDLYEREGKDQHAFCLHVGRKPPYDVRVLANVRDDHYWADTMLHEFGHAVYDKHHDPFLPYFLRSVAHTNTTEAIALMMGSLADDPTWLTEIAGIPEGKTDGAWRMNRLDKLTFVRWALVMYRFEQELYRDPDRDDLNDVWWNLVEELQLVKKPEGRDEPDWAAKIHVATAPVYYHNYVLGELIATQLRAYIESSVTHAPFFREGPGEMAGRYLVEAVFGPGARDSWREAVERATGEPLKPERFVASLLP
ncbi:M2 family metallopeptidase [Rubrobacter indicoceani]|uniref:M2 family metallopeptidase n=1 Tax=Rubrobacter indicoceani TaxID=2051957 RepID=UPI0013C4F9E2|nr:M2 family metallopeptidase [Rubrobacter indicoceani]